MTVSATALLEVTASNGERFDFVSWSRDKVIAAIEQQRATGPQA